MADIQTGRFGKLLQAGFNLKQRLTLGQVLPDVMPTFSLDHPRAENLLHLGEDLCSAYASLTPTAGQYASVGLQMPAQSGKVAIIESISVFAGSATSFRLGLGAGTMGNDGGTLEQFVDVRRPGRPVCTTRTQSAAAPIGGSLALYNVPANTTMEITQPIILGNGLLSGVPVATFLYVESGTVTIALNATFRWRERLLEPQENILT